MTDKRTSLAKSELSIPATLTVGFQLGGESPDIGTRKNTLEAVLPLRINCKYQDENSSVKHTNEKSPTNNIVIPLHEIQEHGVEEVKKEPQEIVEHAGEPIKPNPVMSPEAKVQHSQECKKVIPLLPLSEVIKKKPVFEYIGRDSRQENEPQRLRERTPPKTLLQTFGTAKGKNKKGSVYSERPLIEIKKGMHGKYETGKDRLIRMFEKKDYEGSDKSDQEEVDNNIKEEDEADEKYSDVKHDIYWKNMFDKCTHKIYKKLMKNEKTLGELNKVILNQHYSKQEGSELAKTLKGMREILNHRNEEKRMAYELEEENKELKKELKKLRREVKALLIKRY